MRRRQRAAAGLRRTVRAANVVTLGLLGATFAGLLAFYLGYPPFQAGALVGAPAAIAVAMLRPGWYVIGILVMPQGVLHALPNSLLAVVAALPLVGLSLRRWEADFRLRAGFYPLLAITVLGMVHSTTATGSGDAFAAGLLDLLLYYVLLGALVYNLVRSGELRLQHVAGALVGGAVLHSLIELAINGADAAKGPASLLAPGRLHANIAVFALVVLLVRALERPGWGRLTESVRWNLLLAAPLVAVVGLSLLRAAWLSLALSALFVAWRTGRTRYLMAVPLILGLILAVPTARDRVFPGAPEEGLDLSEYTTGRWKLWTIAMDHVGEESLLVGNGWGYWWSLSPEDLFGDAISFVTEEDQKFVFPHNDGLLMLIDLGLVGLVLWLLLWAQLAVVMWRLLRGPPSTRIPALAFVGVPVTFFISAVVENGFILQGAAERFIIVSGALFALDQLRRQHVARGDERSTSERSERRHGSAGSRAASADR